ncbi:hypothetical protein NSTC745_04551 [Nostoc sp. DSM 114161]|jgi:hypothetical protein|uniref:hypothetical protein n=1 Tax=Nostoc sp. DSM 114161 TaxID=3440143 RepID=UPI0040457C24
MDKETNRQGRKGRKGKKEEKDIYSVFQVNEVHGYMGRGFTAMRYYHDLSSPSCNLL